MRIVIVVIVASIVSILAFKYVNNSLWNAPIAATAEERSEGNGPSRSQYGPQGFSRDFVAHICESRSASRNRAARQHVSIQDLQGMLGADAYSGAPARAGLPFLRAFGIRPEPG
ncbi:hypothetical protein F2981_32240 (plasmid) [Sinorhizobium meliloti]|nr:hypothetical protein [Sinorhizobium meliloti]